MRRRTGAVMLSIGTMLMLAHRPSTGLSLESQPDRAAENAFFVPLLDLGAEWHAELWLRNDDDRIARVHVALLSPAIGSLEGGLQFELVPGAARSFGADALLPGTTLARVEADVRLAGGARFRRTDRNTELWLGGVDRLSREHRLSVAGEDRREFALLNPYPEAVQIETPNGRERVGPFGALRLRPGIAATRASRPLLAVEVTSDSEGQVSALVASDAAWIWPVADDSRRALGQDYATFNALGDNRYHTGLDIGYSTGTAVRFVTSGTLVRVQRLHANDHGFGNSVVARHRTIAGTDVYVQYSHLNSIAPTVLSACGPPDANQRSTCGGNVAAGADVGSVGRSGKGSLTHWKDSHLHLEAKTFHTLSATGDDKGGTEYGYALEHPDQTGAGWPGGARYFDPLTIGFHVATSVAGESRRAKDFGSVHVGPGGMEDGTAGYRPIAQLQRGVEYQVTARAFEPYCSGGWWVQVQGPTLFGDWGLATGKVPDGWTCQTHLEGGPAPAPTPTPPSPTPKPTPTPTPAATPAPAAPQITSLAPATVVGSAFNLTIDGRAFDTTGARDEVYRPDGSYLGGGTVSSRSVTRIVTRESMAGAAPGSYTVRVRTASLDFHGR